MLGLGLDTKTCRKTWVVTMWQSHLQERLNMLCANTAKNFQGCWSRKADIVNTESIGGEDEKRDCIQFCRRAVCRMLVWSAFIEHFCDKKKYVGPLPI